MSCGFPETTRQYSVGELERCRLLGLKEDRVYSLSHWPDTGQSLSECHFKASDRVLGQNPQRVRVLRESALVTFRVLSTNMTWTRYETFEYNLAGRHHHVRAFKFRIGLSNRISYMYTRSLKLLKYRQIKALILCLSTRATQPAKKRSVSLDCVQGQSKCSN